MAKLAAGAGALVVLGLGSLFTGIGEGAANQLITFFAGDPSPSASPTTSSAALTVAVRTDVGSGNDILALPDPVDKGPLADALLAGDLGGQWQPTLDKYKGAPVGNVVVTLVLTGHHARGISIGNIRVQKEKPEAVLEGTQITVHGASESQTTELVTDLDQADLTLRAKDGKPYFTQTHLELKDGEQDTLAITLTASAMMYGFAFVIDYVDETGAARTAFVDREGKLHPTMADVPVGALFTLTGAAPGYGKRWQGRVDGRYLPVP